MNIKLYDSLDENLSIIETILCHRGIALQDIHHFLHTTDEDILDPSLLNNICAGQELIQHHLEQNSKILVWVDCDVDGYCSAAILINYFHKLYPKVDIDYILSFGKQHGIIPDRISDDYRLVIAPDSSSSAFEEHKILKERGIDVCVLDHHIADSESEDAIVINNQLCDYPTKSLSGAGIVYKFCQYFDSVAGTDYANEFLDLTALALIADMMDQRDFETRHIIKKGLTNIKNGFFNYMVQKNDFSLKGEVTPIGVAFYIVPYMNATIRCGTEEEKLILFESLLDFKGFDLIPSTKRGHTEGDVETKIEQACRNCTNIKKKQTSARDASLDEIEQKIKNENLLDDKILIIKTDDFNINPNIRGLIANQIMGKYQRPVMILSHNSKTDLWEGSFRGYGLDSFKEFLKDSGLTAYTAG